MATLAIPDDQQTVRRMRPVRRRPAGVSRPASAQRSRQLEAHLGAVTRSAIDGIVSADAKGMIQSWNPAAERIFGYCADEAMGRSLELIIPERFRAAHRKGMERLNAGGQLNAIGRTVELWAMRKDGSELPIELSLSTWVLDGERYYTGIIRDITDRKTTETQLQQYVETLSRQRDELALAQAQLVESETHASVGRLMAGILHEVNSPVGALGSAADTMARLLGACRELLDAAELGPGRARLERALCQADSLTGVMAEGAERIREVVGGLERFVNLDGSEQRVYDVREALAGASLLVAPGLGEGVRLEQELGDEAAPVCANPTKLNHALLGLLRNAVEAVQGRGTVKLAVRRRGPNVEAIIEDDGCGMSEQELARAFGFEFTRRDGRVRLRLGLATSRRTIEEAGGRLLLSSRPGEGTVVRVVLPAAD